MFTGLIKDKGTVIGLLHNEEGIVLEIQTSLVKDVEVDDSVAVNGVCLTAVKVNEKSIVMQAVHLTLSKTNLGELRIGSLVNLELALKLSDRLGGHIVLGHVNGIAKLTEISNHGENYELWYELPNELMKYVIKEGSIALDGISLTIADVSGNRVKVTIIPHTWQETQISSLQIGANVNVEVDSQAVMMAKFVESMFENYVKNLK